MGSKTRRAVGRWEGRKNVRNATPATKPTASSLPYRDADTIRPLGCAELPMSEEAALTARKGRFLPL